MLTIFRSNRVELLLELLARNLQQHPLSHPLTQEIIVAPSPAMSRWVKYGLAEQLGIASNIHFPLPASFVWELAQSVLSDVPKQDPLELGRLSWEIYGLLPSKLETPAFAALQNYLRGNGNDLKCWQLAHRIADLFDRYQLYRPELIRGWGEQSDETWQCDLWNQLTQDRQWHRVAIIDDLIHALESENKMLKLPERVSLFAISTLPPLLIEVLHALANKIPVDLYLHTPTPEFWADLVSQKVVAKKRLNQPDSAELWEVGHPLLASWGRQGQALQDLLLMSDTPLNDVDAYVEPEPLNLLSRLQNDIFSLLPEEPEQLNIEQDDSVQIHICHSPMRECQVLHDQLLHILQRHPHLRPEDILVMIPDIGLYAPYIEAVFTHDEQESRPFIPWNLSDTSLQDEQPLVQVFLQLLNLPKSRFTHSEFLSYLDVPELAQQFHLDDVAIGQAKAWLSEANVRWGLGAEHKSELGLPPNEENSWKQAEQRLFGGYALEEGSQFAGIAPINSVGGTQADTLGHMWRLFSTLSEQADLLRSSRSSQQWQITLSNLLHTFFGEQEDSEGLIQKIRDAIADFANQAEVVDDSIPLELVHYWLQQNLTGERHQGRFFSGGVTFCGMRPMRNVPFQVIYLLGMDDQAFPRRDNPVEFDLMRQQWRAGDPRKGDEDRYLFLETLLSARQYFCISYVGRAIRTNTECQPSILVRELLDTIDQGYCCSDGSRLSEAVTRVHSLQPFSPQNYATGCYQSFDHYWSKVADSFTSMRSNPLMKQWPTEPLPEPLEPLETITLAQLERFLRHPVRYFVNARLNLYFSDQEVAEDEELFSLDYLDRYWLKKRLLETNLQGKSLSLNQLHAEGSMPHGGFAQIEWNSEWEHVEPILEQLEDYRWRIPAQSAVDIAFESQPKRLTGQLKGIYEFNESKNLMRYQPSKFKGKYLIELWLSHLVWCATEPLKARTSHLFTSDAHFEITKNYSQQEARHRLEDYLKLFSQGLRCPLPLFPDASFVYAERVKSGKHDTIKKAVENAWYGSEFSKSSFDLDDRYIQLIMRGVEDSPIESELFKNLAEQWYLEVLNEGVKHAG